MSTTTPPSDAATSTLDAAGHSGAARTTDAAVPSGVVGVGAAGALDAAGADPRAVAVAYIEAVSRHDLDAVSALLADDAVARTMGGESTKPEWLAALGRLLPALEHNEIRHASVDGETACVVYDFVTNTPAGAVPCVEVVGSREGRIHSIELIFDRVAFAPVNEALKARAN